MECIYRKHMDNKRYIYFCTTNGWWGLIVAFLYWRNAFILSALPLGVLMGLTRRSMKNRPLEMRWKRAWVDLACNETGVGEWNGTLLAVCGRIYLWEDNSRKVKWNDCVDCGMKRLSHLCCAVLRWVKWTERNGVKGGREVRYEQRPPKRNERREWTDRKHMKIKHDLFFDTATTNGWRGTLEVFGQRSGAKALILCGYYT